MEYWAVTLSIDTNTSTLHHTRFYHNSVHTIGSLWDHNCTILLMVNRGLVNHFYNKKYCNKKNIKSFGIYTRLVHSMSRTGRGICYNASSLMP